MAALGMTLGLAGCWFASEDDVATWVQEQRQARPAPLAALTTPPLFVPERYQGADGLSPFNPQRLSPEDSVAVPAAGSGPVPMDARMTWEIQRQQRRKEPLEAVPLERVALVGVVQQSRDAGAQAVALLRANEQLYTVGLGRYVGPNFGRITAITQTAVSVREMVQDEAGAWAPRQVTLTLQGGRP